VFVTILVRRSPAWHVYFALTAFSLAMLGAMMYVLHTGWRLSTEYVPIVRAAARVKLDATLAHLWFEEVLSGDEHESISEVWLRLDSARFYAHAMVQGGQDEEGRIIPLEDARLHRKLGEVERKLTEFRTVTEERQNARQSVVSGTAIDQSYDAVFKELVALTHSVEREVHAVIQRETKSVRQVQVFVMSGAVILSLLVAFVFTRYTRERSQAERALQLKVKAEEEAREHLGKLAHVARLTTMNTLAAGIAHEVNQPLAAIAASAAACRRLVSAGRIQSEEHLSALELIGGEAERAGDVLRRLRTFVSKHDGHYELVDVNELVRVVVRLAHFDPQMRNAKIQLELTDILPSVEADVVQIQQVLLNLVRNGVEAMQNTQEQYYPIIVRTRKDDRDQVEVSVVDRGIGLSEAIASDPFRPFITTKDSGMGMGLSISNSIISAHGGRIWFRRNQGHQGTTVLFTLPAAARRGS